MVESRVQVNTLPIKLFNLRLCVEKEGEMSAKEGT